MSADPARPAPRSRLRRALRAIAFATAPLAALLVLLELVLWAAGLGAPSAQKALLRGFDDGASYLVPDPDRPGGWATQMFDAARDEVHVPPRDGRLRVLLFGGSNTFLMPEAELQERLDHADPGRGHEVLNLGRPGYGSGRVLVLLRQALERLQPDVLLVYCGHNEFVEGGFAAELAETWSSPLWRGVAQVARHLRTVNVLTDLLRDAARSGEARRPVGVTQSASNFSLRYEETLAVHERYRANLQAIAQLAREQGAGLVLCTVVGNDLCQPVEAHLAPTRTPQEALAFNRALAKAGFLAPKRLLGGLFRVGADDVLRLQWTDWGEHVMPGDPRAGASTGRAPSPLRPLAPPLDGGPLWLDPSNWTAKTFDVLQTVSAFHRAELTAPERADLALAEQHVQRALSLAPEHALAVFEQGLFRALQGDATGALALLRRAAELDCCPNRGNDLSNGIVHDVAAAWPEVRLLDAEALFRARTPDGLVGYELVMDNCHLHPGARSALMADCVAPVIAAAER